MKRLALLFLALPLIGCPTAERAAFQTLASDQAALNAAQSAYEASAALPGGSCATAAVGTPCIPHTKVSFDAITKAKQADALAVTLMEQYEQAKATGASQSMQAAALADANNAIAALGPIIAEIKSLYGGRP
jgi:hypothetical protein